MKIRVLFFAAARERTGTGEVELNIGEGASVGDLRVVLAQRFPDVAETLSRSMIALNAEYATDEITIPAGAEVACIPPVSGG